MAKTLACREMIKHDPGYGTEYRANFCWSPKHDKVTAQSLEGGGLFNKHASTVLPKLPECESYCKKTPQLPPGICQFKSTIYPSIYREVGVPKDERGNYYNINRDITTKPYGRKLLYDPSHPDKMYGSQWSSELAEHNGPYSFPSPSKLPPELPWTKDLMWKHDCENGAWPTARWKEWTELAKSPKYIGYSDQIEARMYKVQPPYPPVLPSNVTC